MNSRQFTPFHAGTFHIIPAGFPVTNQEGIPLYLGKKGAFGSGEHETTAACLELLAETGNITGQRVLDLGSGTGILALGAAALGASQIIALDLDWDASLSCQENVLLNHYHQVIFPVCGELAALSHQPFFLVMANIYIDILLPLAELITALVQPGGYLLLSGIPLQDKFDIVRRYGSLDCTVIDSRIGEDFATYLFRNDAI